MRRNHRLEITLSDDEYQSCLDRSGDTPLASWARLQLMSVITVTPTKTNVTIAVEPVPITPHNTSDFGTKITDAIIPKRFGPCRFCKMHQKANCQRCRTLQREGRLDLSLPAIPE